MGTELAWRGVPTPEGPWSALALDTAPDVVAAVHGAYAAAGAAVHTTNTFRTRPRTVGPRWGELVDRAVGLARSAGGVVAGSIAPIEDCYRPDLSPPDPGPEHAALARRLAAAGVDLLLCETFPHVGEALAAVDAAVATGLPTWVAFTAGPRADLLTPAEVAAGARAAVDRGAGAVLINCVPVADTLRYVDALAGLSVPIGAYANAGGQHDGLGWDRRDQAAADAYADAAERWVDAGCTLVGGCCGTCPTHIAALRARFG